MKYTAGQAAKEVGKTKSTITKAISSGKLSATKEKGAWQIDASELFRVFPKETVEKKQLETPQVNTDALERLIRSLEEQLDDVKADRDEWRKQAQQTQLLLADQRKKKIFGLF